MKKYLLVFLLVFPLFYIAIVQQPSIEWPYYRGCLSGTGFSLSKAPSTYSQPKYITIGSKTLLHDDPPIIFGGKAFVITSNGTLICVDYRSGKIVWSKPGNFSPPTVYEGKLYTIDYTDIVCLDIKNGKEIWRKPGGSKGLCLAVANKKVVAPSGLYIQCLDADTGEKIWALPMSNRYLCPWSPTIYKNKVYFSGLNGLYCIDLDTGKEIWSSKIKGWHELAIEDDKIIAVILKDVEDYAYVVALNANNGNILWSTRLTGYLSGTTSLAIAYGKVFVTCKKDTLHKNPGETALFALDLNNGNILWKQYFPPCAIFSSPLRIAVADRKIFVTVRQCGLYCYDVDSGNLLWNFSTVNLGTFKKIYVYSSPVVAENHVFVLGAYDDYTAKPITIEYLIVFGEFKKSSSISLTVSKSEINIGEDTTLNVDLNPKKSVDIVVEARHNFEEWIEIYSGKTDNNGLLTYTWKPDKAGKWEIRAKWSGDDEYEGCVSNIVDITVNKVAPTIMLTSTVSAKLNSEYILEGNLNPPISNIVITITYMSPSGKSVTHQVYTDNNGHFRDTYIFGEKGTWKITITIPESENTFEKTKTINVEVKREEIIPSILLLLLVIIIVIVTVVIIVILFLRKRKTLPPPPPPPPPYY